METRKRKINFFSRLSNRLLIVSFLIALVPLTALGIFTYINTSRFIIDNSIEKLESEVTDEASRIETRLESYYPDINLLANTPPIQGIIRAKKNGGIDPVDNSTLEQWESRIEQIFSILGSSDPSYLSLRWIDENGQEIIRVDSDGAGIDVVKGDRLQYKGNRGYFQEAMQLEYNQVYVSPLELNREGTPPIIERPLKPVIRYALRVFDEQTNQAKGIIVVNIDFNAIFKNIITASKFKAEDDSLDLEFVIDQDGYYIVHPNSDKTFGDEENLGTNEKLANDFDSDLVSEILNKNDGIYNKSRSDYVVVHGLVEYGPYDDRYFIVVDILDRSLLLTPVSQLRTVTLLTAGFLILIILIFTFLFTKSITRPILRLTKVAQDIADGNFDTPVKVNEQSEIGRLARALKMMKETISKSQTSLIEQVEKRTVGLKTQTQELAQQRRAVLNILEDVEDEKEKSQALAQDLQKYKLATDSTSDHIIITDPHGIVIYANKAVERITGFKRSEVIGKKAGSSELWGGQMDIEFYKKMWHTISKDKKTFQGEINNVRKGGTPYIAYSTISPILNDKKEVSFFVGIERDITKDKEIDKAKSEFVSLASHQLRTPLSTINWYTEMLMSGDAGKVNEQQLEFLKAVYQGSKRMVDLVNALLNVSRIDLGTLAVDPEMIDLSEIAKSVLQELTPQVQKKEHQIVTNFEQLPKLSHDPKLVRIVFQNFLTNAVKYTPAKGKIEVSVVKDGEFAKIAVKDNGYGIPRDQQGKIFTKLFRADNVREKETDGTGLGLYIVKSIIENGGGKIWFESELDKGTTFYATIPLSGVKKQEGSKTLIEKKDD